MPLTFSCATCGAELKPKDEASGRPVKCPHCGASLVLPEPTVFVPISPQPPGVYVPIENHELGRDLKPVEETTQKSPKRPFWKDPVVVIGSAVPTLILVVFFGYLYQDYDARSFPLWVAGENERAARLARDGKNQEAYDIYTRVVAAGDRRTIADPGTRVDVDLARGASVKLQNLLDTERERLVEDRKAALEYMQRLTASLAEFNRLQKVRAEIHGTAWLTNKGGGSRPLAGLIVTLLPREKSRDELLPAFQDTRTYDESLVLLSEKWSEEHPGRSPPKPEQENLAIRKKIQEVLDEIRKGDETDLIDLKALRGVIHLATTGAGEGRSEASKYDVLSKERLWRVSAETLKVASTHTDLEGKYTFGDVKGGRYYLAATSLTEVSFVEWFVPVEVTKDGKVSQDLFNETADVIYNNL
jgi:DNA-directed RNA polymerase subunit RPC12/RpoP